MNDYIGNDRKYPLLMEGIFLDSRFFLPRLSQNIFELVHNICTLYEQKKKEDYLYLLKVVNIKAHEVRNPFESAYLFFFLGNMACIEKQYESAIRLFNVAIGILVDNNIRDKFIGEIDRTRAYLIDHFEDFKNNSIGLTVGQFKLRSMENTQSKMIEEMFQMEKFHEKIQNMRNLDDIDDVMKLFPLNNSIFEDQISEISYLNGDYATEENQKKRQEKYNQILRNYEMRNIIERESIDNLKKRKEEIKVDIKEESEEEKIEELDENYVCNECGYELPPFLEFKECPSCGKSLAKKKKEDKFSKFQKRSKEELEKLMQVSLDEGIYSLNSHKYDMALLHFRESMEYAEFLENKPALMANLLKISEIHQQLDEKELALKSVEKAVEILDGYANIPYRFRALISLAHLHIAYQNLNKAEVILTQIENLAQSDFFPMNIADYALLNKLRQEIQEERNLKKITDLNEDIDSTDIPANLGMLKLLVEASEYFGKKDYKKALKFLNRAYQIAPHNHQSFVLIAECEKKLGNYELAVDWLDKALKISPDSEELFGFMGEAYSILGNDEMAEKYLNLAINHKKKTLEGHVNIGTTHNHISGYYIFLGNFEKALEHVQLSFASPDVVIEHHDYYIMGMALKGVKKYKEAISNFSKALELNPDHAESLLSIGECYEILGNRKEAIESLEKAVKCDPQWKKITDKLRELNSNSDLLNRKDPKPELTGNVPFIKERTTIKQDEISGRIGDPQKELEGLKSIIEINLNNFLKVDKPIPNRIKYEEILKRGLEKIEKYLNGEIRLELNYIDADIKKASDVISEILRI